MAVIKNFDEIVERVKGFSEPMRVIVAAAQDEHTLQAIKHAQEEGIAKPVLVGDKAEIDKICAEIGLVVPEEDIYDVPDGDSTDFKTGCKQRDRSWNRPCNVSLRI